MGYLSEERETIIRYDNFTGIWYCWTNCAKHIDKLVKLGWEIVEEQVENGNVIARKFKCSKKPISFRDVKKQ